MGRLSVQLRHSEGSPESSHFAKARRQRLERGEAKVAGIHRSQYLKVESYTEEVPERWIRFP